jgi:ubiquinone/menaquinone biosynthesis C-methylase UbiE
VSIISTFDDSDAYERQMGRWSKRLAEPFLDFAGLIDGDRILDVGCGNGSLTFAIANRSKPFSLIGVDRTAAFIDHAKAKNTNPVIQFQLGDACALPFPNSSFDRVLSLLVLHFIPDTQKALSELRRIACSGATVAAAVWDGRGGFVAQRMF